MLWLKQVLLDLIVTLVILLHALGSMHWVEIPLIIYTLLLLLMKFTGLRNRRLLRQMKKNPASPPDWFYHALYALNVVALGVSQHWVTGLLWICVWLISWLTSRKMQGLQQISPRKR